MKPRAVRQLAQTHLRVVREVRAKSLFQIPSSESFHLILSMSLCMPGSTENTELSSFYSYLTREERKMVS